MRKRSAIFGFCAVFTFLSSLAVFASLSPDFNLLHDLVSKLGSHGQPYAVWWNLIGFGIVGILLGVFGATYGIAIGDTLVAVLLALFGASFVGAAIPAYLDSPNVTQTKMLFVAVTFSMAFWCLALARLTSKPAITRRVRTVSYVSTLFVVLAFIGYVVETTSAAIFQRLFFGGIFFWVVAISWDNLFTPKRGDTGKV